MRPQSLKPPVRRASLLALAACLLSGVTGGCAPDSPGSVLPVDAQAVSLLGDTLTRSMLDSSGWPLQDSLLAEARVALEISPGDPDAMIWVGRRLGYLGRYDEAIAVFTSGQVAHPGDARFLRHRGHRKISVRDFSGAAADLRRAWNLVRGDPDQVEPDGLPNAAGIPTSTLHSNIRYHLGLAFYLLGDWESAREAFQADVDAVVNPDMQVASSYWLYLILRRMGDEDGAETLLESISADMEIIENGAYHELLLLFKGVRAESNLLGQGEATLQGTSTAYGIGAWHLINGDSTGAWEIFAEIVQERSQWPAFGYVAAEVELARGGS